MANLSMVRQLLSEPHRQFEAFDSISIEVPGPKGQLVLQTLDQELRSEGLPGLELGRGEVTVRKSWGEAAAIAVATIQLLALSDDQWRTVHRRVRDLFAGARGLDQSRANLRAVAFNELIPWMDRHYGGPENWKKGRVRSFDAMTHFVVVVEDQISGRRHVLQMEIEGEWALAEADEETQKLAITKLGW